MNVRRIASGIDRKLLPSTVFRIPTPSTTMLIFNNVGILMLAASFITVFIMRAISGMPDDGAVNMLIAGPALSLLDVLYRVKSKGFFAPAKGGSFFFLPAWVMGILMVALGIVARVNGVR